MRDDDAASCHDGGREKTLVPESSKNYHKDLTRKDADAVQDSQISNTPYPK